MCSCFACHLYVHPERMRSCLCVSPHASCLSSAQCMNMRAIMCLSESSTLYLLELTHIASGCTSMQIPCILVLCVALSSVCVRGLRSAFCRVCMCAVGGSVLQSKQEEFGAEHTHAHARASRASRAETDKKTDRHTIMYTYCGLSLSWKNARTDTPTQTHIHALTRTQIRICTYMCA